MTETYTSGLWIVKAGEDDAFVAAWREFVTWAAEQDGHGTFRLLQDMDNPAHYLSIAPWDTFEAQENWRALEEFSERIGRVRDHCSEFVPSIYQLAAQVD
jgi:heme-degrading monooxygenase HmoA